MSAIAGCVNFHNLHDRILLKPKKIGVTEKIDFKLVHLTPTAHPVPGNQEFCLAPSETIVEMVKKNKKSHLGYSLRVRTSGVMHGSSLVHFT